MSKHITNRLLCSLVIASFFIIIGCDQKVFFFEKSRIQGEKWDLMEQFEYRVSVEDTVNPYDFSINVRNNDQYPYSNIFFFIKTSFPNGSFAMDTVECTLADKEGHWYGKSSGKLHDHLFLFRERIRFPMKGEYVFEVSHGMRDTLLPGIKDIGIKIDKHDQR